MRIHNQFTYDLPKENLPVLFATRSWEQWLQRNRGTFDFYMDSSNWLKGRIYSATKFSDSLRNDKAYSFTQTVDEYVATPWGNQPFMDDKSDAFADGFEYDLSGLNNEEFIEAKLAIRGDTFGVRCRSMASCLGTDATRLQRRVQGFLYRVPRQNMQYHREDLEQAIWTQLRYVHKRDGFVPLESWKMYREVEVAYLRWYTKYSQERQLGVEAVNRAYELQKQWDRAIRKGEMPKTKGLPETLPKSFTYAEYLTMVADLEMQRANSTNSLDFFDDSNPKTSSKEVQDTHWDNWESMVDGNLDMTRLFESFPERIKTVCEKRFNGAVLTATERKYISRWLATNEEQVRAIIDGEHTGEIEWNKPKR